MLKAFVDMGSGWEEILTLDMSLPCEELESMLRAYQHSHPNHRYMLVDVLVDTTTTLPEYLKIEIKEQDLHPIEPRAMLACNCPVARAINRALPTGYYSLVTASHAYISKSKPSGDVGSYLLTDEVRYIQELFGLDGTSEEVKNIKPCTLLIGPYNGENL